ncbi:acyl carrier protein [Xanthovirga aplysinae]|uniref:acyl carrier protein n=1 Tax=Xanthovirga aplysinae TaxID=2529853 RepID=UPI0012BD26DB|nr:phosphopantetheine-binding protein [Xanthovirga aplysinae]MTI32987.1 acyl carrier protein [Xanthovirga aplysinae]
MEKDEKIEKLKSIIKPYLEDESVLDTLKEDQDLVSQLGIDSVDFYEVIINMEEEFDIEIADKDIESIKTFKDLLSVLDLKLNPA